ncbi:hypothetical protein H9P43_006384 [Blastocladiella emersonii ATCC 22665]|nr:hypothetical protein H9P43_006384 [Blastocladiella emersonii ATCC 22665]
MSASNVNQAPAPPPKPAAGGEAAGTGMLSKFRTIGKSSGSLFAAAAAASAKADAASPTTTATNPPAAIDRKSSHSDVSILTTSSNNTFHSMTSNFTTNMEGMFDSLTKTMRRGTLASNHTTATTNTAASTLNRGEDGEPEIPLGLTLTYRFRNLTECPVDEWSMESNITTLILSNNQLTSIPDALCQLPNLRTLSLGMNRIAKLNGQLSDLGTLETLNLSGNLLTTEAVNAINWPLMVSLRSLHLVRNRLARFPTALVATELTTLALSENAIDTIPPEIVEMTNLQWLGLSNNKLRSIDNLLKMHPMSGITVANNPLEETDQLRRCLRHHARTLRLSPPANPEPPLEYLERARTMTQRLERELVRELARHASAGAAPHSPAAAGSVFEYPGMFPVPAGYYGTDEVTVPTISRWRGTGGRSQRIVPTVSRTTFAISPGGKRGGGGGATGVTRELSRKGGTAAVTGAANASPASTWRASTAKPQPVRLSSSARSSNVTGSGPVGGSAAGSQDLAATVEEDEGEEDEGDARAKATAVPASRTMLGRQKAAKLRPSRSSNDLLTQRAASPTTPTAPASASVPATPRKEPVTVAGEPQSVVET